MKDLLLFVKRLESTRGRGYSRRRASSAQKGVIKEGSCTDKVLAVLRDVAPRAIGKAEIVERSQCAPKSVDWALHYLRETRRVRCRSAMDGRSPLYLKYQIVEEDSG